MGILKITNNKHQSIIGIWLLEESVEELKSSLAPSLLNEMEYHNLKSDKRKKEWLGTRNLIQQVFNDETIQIHYNSDGKPLLSNRFNISIAHSGNYIAIIVNEKIAVGIDIQIKKKQIIKGKNLFMSAKEVNDLGNDYLVEKLHIYWCAKESLYKYKGEKGFNVFSDFTINHFELDNGNILSGRINKTEELVRLEYEITNDFFLVNTI